jgi:hypothetical protein
MSTKITTPELFNLSSNNTAATQLPVFTTSARPTPTTSTVTVDYLVVGGGAGTYAGGGANYPGGGGAGGLRTSYGSTSGGGAVAEPSISLSKATSYNITVGQASLDGEDSVFGSITSLGGGRSGATASTAAGSSGGSGGGASGDAYNAAGGSGTANQGYSGGNSGSSCSGGSCRYPGGGGGGAASAGTNATTTTAGNGGDGLEVNIIGGTGNYYAGGGGGSSYLSGAGTGGLGGGGNGSARLSGSEVVNNGTANTGGGGGGGLVASSTPALGGSGVVILRYPTSSSLNIITTGSLVYTESTDGSDTVIQFTEGSGNFGFASAGIAVGEMIFNSTTEKVEYWDGFQWNMIKDESQIDPTKDLILYLDANDSASGISNTSWVDVSANNYSLTAIGTPVLGGTSPQKEYDIASGDYFRLPNTAPPFGNTNGVIAAECWVKLNTNTSRAYWFSTSSTTNQDDYFFMGWLADYNNVYIAYRNGTTSDQYFELGALNGNTSWQHIFCQLNGSTKEIWINGVQQSTTSNGTGPSSGWVDYVSYATATSTNIGILRKATTAYGNAKYGQIRYWSASKTQAEIIAFFNQRATDFGKTPIT